MSLRKKSISIKSIITIVSVSILLFSTIVIGYLIISRWLSSAEKEAERIVENLGENIYNQVSSFMHIPHSVNEVNHKVIEYGILDLSNEKLREKFFVGVLSAQSPHIYSFSYGTANGEYYGALRNEKGVIEIMRNDASTGGNSWYYSVNEDLTAGERVVQAGKFDPRTRAWYKAAEESGGPALSPLYKHFVMDDLTVSFSWPVYDASGSLQGVMGTHILLSDIGSFLVDAVRDYSAYAIVADKETGSLIANSMGVDNFTVLPDGSFSQRTVDDIGFPDIEKAFIQSTTNRESPLFYRGEEEKLFINMREIEILNATWVVMSAIPEAFYMKDVIDSIHLTVIIVVVALVLLLIIYHILARKLMKPLDNLIEVSTALSKGDLSKRVEVVRSDEIGMISESLNRVADKLQFLINNLEESVIERTRQLQRANEELKESKNELQLLLDSTAEGIYGIDLNGDCTFCNASSVKLLGFSGPEDILGKNVHRLIHHSRRDGTTFPIEECKIVRSIKHGRGFQTDDEVFWKADGSSFDVEYRSYPQMRNGEVVGGVITFSDITERKKREEEIKYLSSHDVLTGLLNRSSLAQIQKAVDVEENLPISVIVADINGLKMTNDVFGHAAGDELIKESARILLESCRERDLIARVGGDEFVVILPGTSEKETESIASRIKEGFSDARVQAVKCSISLGFDTKTRADQSLNEIMANAESFMYKDKTIHRKSLNRQLIDSIIDTLHTKYPMEKQHSIAVSELCGEIGSAMKLSQSQINVLKRAGYLHDIGKIVLDESILSKDTYTALTEEEREKIKQHSIVGYRILNLFDETLDIAEYTYSHHERWDGSGYPRGLKGEQIPLISRIISIAGAYDRVMNRVEGTLEEKREAALKVIREDARKQFDPNIARLFIQMMDGKNA